MCWTGWPNARNISIIFNATCQSSCAPGSWLARSGPHAHALAQRCYVNVAKRVHHHATSKMLHEKFDCFQIWSNNIQHVATHRNRVARRMQHVPKNVARCCGEMLRAFGQALNYMLTLSSKLQIWCFQVVLVQITANLCAKMRAVARLFFLFKPMILLLCGNVVVAVVVS